MPAAALPEPTAPRIWFVYLLECQNGLLYAGITPDLATRFALHCSGRGAAFTRINKPARMLAAIACTDRSAASRLEWRIKQLRPQQKRSLAASWPMQNGLPSL